MESKPFPGKRTLSPVIQKSLSPLKSLSLLEGNQMNLVWKWF